MRRPSLTLLAMVTAFVIGVGQASAATSPWRIVPSPSPSGQANYLTSVVQLGANDAWAVGAWYRPIATPGTLTEHWDGTRWSRIPSPNRNQGYNELYGVSAVSSSDVWAVGYYNVSSYVSEKTLIEHWDGARWKLVPSPNVGSNANQLYGAAAIAPDDVWAVGLGNSTDIDHGVSVAEHWDGTAWTVVRVPKVGTGANALYAVTAVGADDVWAVGDAEGQGAIVLHYDGSAWSVVPNAVPPGSDSELAALAAASSDDIWAVGGMNGKTLTEHWDGTAWTVVPSPNGPKPTSVLSGVAIDSTGAWAVGASYDDVTVQYRTLTERWDGSSWKLVPSPSPDSISALEGVATGPGGAWAVGASHIDTLVLHAD
jgi:hypothetical protein